MPARKKQVPISKIEEMLVRVLADEIKSGKIAARRV
jgi:hypothetical protein